jgi:hypothetical protein
VFFAVTGKRNLLHIDLDGCNKISSAIVVQNKEKQHEKHIR